MRQVEHSLVRRVSIAASWGEEFHDDFAHGFEDRVVEDAGLVVGDAAVTIAVVRKFILHALSYFAEGVVFVLFAEAISLVDKDLEVDARVMFCEKDGSSKEFVDTS